MSFEAKYELLADILGEPQASGGELLFFCVKCKHHKKKLSVNISKNSFKCWVCDYRSPNIYRLVRRYGTYQQRQEWLKIDGTIDFSNENTNVELFSKQEVVEETVSLPAEFITLTGKQNSVSANSAFKYLFDRGLSRQDILRWKIGYCPNGEYAGRIIIPSFNLEGKLNYFIARTYRDDWLRYKNPPLSRNNIIFNHLYVDWDNDLVLTEGIFDAIVAGNAVPLLGSSLNENSKLFMEIVRHDTPIYLALDPDAEKKSKILIREMMKYGIELHKVDVSGYKDVGSMSREEFAKRKEKATPMNGESYLKYELQGIV